MKFLVFWHVISCRLVNICRYNEGRNVVVIRVKQPKYRSTAHPRTLDTLSNISMRISNPALFMNFVFQGHVHHLYDPVNIRLPPCLFSS